jgi:hypothetical protein
MAAFNWGWVRWRSSPGWLSSTHAVDSARSGSRVRGVWAWRATARARSAVAASDEVDLCGPDSTSGSVITVRAASHVWRETG